ncbi:heterokaryon incompatibility protein-domain-containing protein [Dactylonectria macrodidyma]|uniref:Heterokaryon incompatibility protein-domain-containing protein n=1 Tax=Dactylonectria macrodidyma TaxID=307937 RepID=A0A9P9FK66_9HYPO|nr:heterokaryon incompatibility protein-domain-containing protein [Dactylonectria macrodidyma]
MRPLAQLARFANKRSLTYAFSATKMTARICGTRAGESQRKNEINAIKAWMTKCESDHGSFGCGTVRSRALPARLIEIRATIDTARLISVASLGQAPEFVALSYCWGLTGNLQTLSSTLAQMEECIPISALPLTVKQAFEMVIALGFRYLWVDALCIIQDDEVDWQREARKMGAVYSNAALVIAAMASRATQDGLYSKTDDASLTNDIFHSVMLACRTMPRKQWEDFIQKDLPLLCRGWGFQERLLARRVIHFTPAELVWECKGDVWCRCGNINKFHSTGGRINNMSAAFWHCVDNPTVDRVRPMWRECVKTFSRRSLTMLHDRGFAVTGVAELLRGSSCADLYISGLWKDALPFDLLWRCDQSTTLQAQKQRKPSWSWVSVDCGINWPVAKDPGTMSISAETYFESGLDGVNCKHVGADETRGDYNPISADQIHLQAKMVEVNVVRKADPEDEISPFWTLWDVERPGGQKLSFYPDIHLSDEETRSCVSGQDNSRTLYYLEIIIPKNGSRGWQAGLIIRKVEGSRYGEERYERIGIAGEMSRVHQEPVASFVPAISAEKVILI